ncbi:MAG: hypothetical protein ACE5HL_08005 [Terriglobia bacterium]
MTFTVLLGTLLVTAAVVAAVRQGVAARRDRGPLGLGVKEPESTRKRG